MSPPDVVSGFSRTDVPGRLTHACVATSDTDASGSLHFRATSANFPTSDDLARRPGPSLFWHCS